VRRPSGLSSLYARSSLGSDPFGASGLTGPPGRHGKGNYVMARGVRSDQQLELNAFRGAKGGIAMFDRPSSAVDVTIGGETRVYEAFVTTAPATLDKPSTVTLSESSFSEVAGWAADPIPFDVTFARTRARLVLIRSADLELQKAYYREGRYLLAPTDPVLVDANTLQHWLWNRLAMPCEEELH